MSKSPPCSFVSLPQHKMEPDPPRLKNLEGMSSYPVPWKVYGNQSNVLVPVDTLRVQYSHSLSSTSNWIQSLRKTSQELTSVVVNWDPSLLVYFLNEGFPSVFPFPVCQIENAYSWDFFSISKIFGILLLGFYFTFSYSLPNSTLPYLSGSQIVGCTLGCQAL